MIQGRKMRQNCTYWLTLAVLAFSLTCFCPESSQAFSSPEKKAGLHFDLGILNISNDSLWRMTYGLGFRYAPHRFFSLGIQTSWTAPHTVAGFTEIASLSTLTAHFTYTASVFTFAMGGGAGIGYDGIVGSMGGVVPGPLVSAQLWIGKRAGMMAQFAALMGIFNLAHVSIGVFWPYYSSSLGFYYAF
jgi:hypothetical protein